MAGLFLEDLNDEEIHFIVGETGCGSKGADVPDFIFLEACQQHDLEYWIGGGKEDRKEADIRFLEGMKAAAQTRDSWWSRCWYLMLANVYYWGVRLGAAKFFWYGDQRGRAELDAALAEQREGEQ